MRYKVAKKKKKKKKRDLQRIAKKIVELNNNLNKLQNLIDGTRQRLIYACNKIDNISKIYHKTHSIFLQH